MKLLKLGYFLHARTQTARFPLARIPLIDSVLTPFILLLIYNFLYDKLETILLPRDRADWLIRF